MANSRYDVYWVERIQLMDYLSIVAASNITPDISVIAAYSSTLKTAADATYQFSKAIYITFAIFGLLVILASLLSFSLSFIMINRVLSSTAGIHESELEVFRVPKYIDEFIASHAKFSES